MDRKLDHVENNGSNGLSMACSQLFSNGKICPWSPFRRTFHFVYHFDVLSMRYENLQSWSCDFFC